MGMIPLYSCLIACCCCGNQDSSVQKQCKSSHESRQTLSIRNGRTAMQIKNGRFEFERRSDQSDIAKKLVPSLQEFDVDCDELQIESVTNGDVTAIRLVCQDAQIRFGDKSKARADRLVFDSKTQQLTLQGHVEINYTPSDNRNSVRIMAREMMIKTNGSRVRFRTVRCELSGHHVATTKLRNEEDGGNKAHQNVNNSAFFTFWIGLTR